MAFLFDENLSWRLPELLADVFPGSSSVEALGMRTSSDEAVWAHALAHGLAIVTRDDDFVARSAVLGQPPKVIWIALGNCSTAQVEALIRWRRDDIRMFLDHPAIACLELR